MQIKDMSGPENDHEFVVARSLGPNPYHKSPRQLRIVEGESWSGRLWDEDPYDTW